MKPRVLVTEPIHKIGWDLLATETEAVAWAGQEKEPLGKAMEAVQAVLVRVARLPAEVIRGAKHLRIIAKHGVGYDNIDVSAATACRVVLTNTPTANSLSVAEHALALLLAVARRIGESDRDLTLGKMRTQKSYQGIELSGKVMGVIGIGGAGLHLARITGRGLSMRVIGYDPYKDPWPEGVERCRELGALLAEADFVSIHVPLTQETRNLIGSAALARMKATSVLVNTSRGGIVDETAVAQAIRSGRLGGAGLDVVVDEPLKVDHPLVGLPNVILTPHVAGVTEEAMINMARSSAEDILRILRGERPRYPVNPEVLMGGDGRR
ncbi:MAG TPA: hydroxyacid dehydrogenase [Candidatus Acidoferrum sp.]|nr:hydroxyacid dehydrogenase [Candidatus Methylomirabilis sp.]HWU39732.1 hydroxyacid dehydrogenase [Candidatus Acidoferrum sp.]